MAGIEEKAVRQNKLKKKAKHGSSMSKRKRQQNRIRKSENQIQVLIVEFKSGTEWTKEKVAYLSAKTGLSESQVYKWNWDQRKKFIQGIDSLDAEVTRDEFGGYCCKRWGKQFAFESDDFSDDDNICDLLGFDVEKKAREIVEEDLEARNKVTSSPMKQHKLLIVQTGLKKAKGSPENKSDPL